MKSRGGRERERKVSEAKENGENAIKGHIFIFSLLLFTFYLSLREGWEQS